MFAARNMTFAGAFSPLSLSPALWLDASDASTLYNATSGGSLVAADGAIARWEDKSGNARHATQETGVSRPLRKTSSVNSLDIVRFDGSNDFMIGSQILTTASFSFFAVVKAVAQQNKNIMSQRDVGVAEPGRMHFFVTDDVDSPYSTGRLFFNNETSYSVRTTSIAFDNTAKILYSQSDNAGNSHVRVNGGAAEGSLTGQNWTPNPKPSQLGGLNSVTSNIAADFCEILVFPLLSDADRQAVESYLNAKWAIY